MAKVIRGRKPIQKENDCGCGKAVRAGDPRKRVKSAGRRVVKRTK